MAVLQFLRRFVPAPSDDAIEQDSEFALSRERLKFKRDLVRIQAAADAAVRHGEMSIRLSILLIGMALGLGLDRLLIWAVTQ